jgi:hypothetical protein
VIFVREHMEVHSKLQMGIISTLGLCAHRVVCAYAMNNGNTMRAALLHRGSATDACKFCSMFVRSVRELWVSVYCKPDMLIRLEPNDQHLDLSEFAGAVLLLFQVIYEWIQQNFLSGACQSNLLDVLICGTIPFLMHSDGGNIQVTTFSRNPTRHSKTWLDCVSFFYRSLLNRVEFSHATFLSTRHFSRDVILLLCKLQQTTHAAGSVSPDHQSSQDTLVRCLLLLHCLQCTISAVPQSSYCDRQHVGTPVSTSLCSLAFSTATNISIHPQSIMFDIAFAEHGLSDVIFCSEDGNQAAKLCLDNVIRVAQTCSLSKANLKKSACDEGQLSSTIQQVSNVVMLCHNSKPQTIIGT